MFDDKFVWGVASSAYQVEGTDPDDGRGKTVWDTFTEQGRIFQNQNAYTSCDHMIPLSKTACENGFPAKKEN